jgi:glucose-6-phosphate-specific signal transduction histidine kinase
VRKGELAATEGANDVAANNRISGQISSSIRNFGRTSFCFIRRCSLLLRNILTPRVSKLDISNGQPLATQCARDNDVGFDTHTTCTGNGLKNIRLRTARLKGSLKPGKQAQQWNNRNLLRPHSMK